MILRLRFSKQGKIRFVGHRDVARIFERALRVAEVPVAYSQGFSPRPKLAFGLALSVGYSSDNEYLDVHLDRPVDLCSTATALAAALPEGLMLIEVGEIERPFTSLMEAVTSCSWMIDLGDIDESTIRASVDAILAADRVMTTRERKGKPVEDDIRPDLLSLKVLMNTTIPTVLLDAELGTMQRSLRPAELLAALDPSLAPAGVRRTNQWISSAAARIEPHEVAVARAAPTIGWVT